MAKNIKKITLPICSLVLLTLCISCSNISDPSLAVIQYFQCLQKGDCQAAGQFTESGQAIPDQYKDNQVLSLIIPESTIQRPTTVKKGQDSAIIKIKLIVPDLKATLDSGDENQVNAWDGKDIKEVFSSIKKEDMSYETIETQVTAVQMAGEWKISEDKNDLFEQILLTYTQKEV